MHTKVGATPAYVLSQLTTAVVGAACFVASIAFFDSAKTALFQPVLSVSPSQFSWIGNVTFDFNHDAVAPSKDASPNIEALVTTHVDQELKKISNLELHAKLERKKAFARVARLARARRERVRRLEITQSDRVQLSQALAVTPIEVATSPETSEEEKLRNIHLALMSQFRLAMNELPSLPMTTQVAQVVNTQRIGGSDLGLDGVPEAPKPPKKSSLAAVVAAQIQQEQDEKTEEAPAPAAIPAATDAVDSVHLSASAEKISNLQNTQENKLKSAKIIAAEKLGDELSGYEDIPAPPTDEQVRPIQVASNIQSRAPPLESIAPPAEPNTVQPEPEAHADAQPTALDPAPKSETISFMGSTLILPAEYPNPKPKPGYSNPNTVVLNTHPQPSAVTPALPHTSRDTMTDADEPVVPSSNNDVAGNAVTPARKPSALMAAVAPPSILSTVNAIETPVNVSFVEAFDWVHAVSDAQTEILTREDASEPYGHSQVGWRISRSSEHWPTVYWNRKGDVPLLSKNSAKMLALKAATALQSEAGIVIARAPAGWSLEFSGRSEHPLIFNLANQLLANDSIEEERYYVFLNASPGAQILYLVKSGETGALTLPVFGGMLSFADLSQPEKKELSGKLIDASSKNTRGLSGMRVQLIGSGQTTVTNGSGVFHLDNVIGFGNQPVYVEAEMNRGYPHRYKLNLTDGKSGKLPLFVMSEEQVHEWVGQLEGGISTESGLIVAALPTVAAANEDKKPMPTIKTLATDPTLVPETYTVSSSGQLQVKTPMSATNSRLVGVQVPEGPAIVQLTDRDGRVLWSELLVISPRVLSVIGPY